MTISESLSNSFLDTCWQVSKHFILHDDLFERVKKAFQQVKNKNFIEAAKIMNETPATAAIWLEILKKLRR